MANRDERKKVLLSALIEHAREIARKDEDPLRALVCTSRLKIDVSITGYCRNSNCGGHLPLLPYELDQEIMRAESEGTLHVGQHFTWGDMVLLERSGCDKGGDEYYFTSASEVEVDTIVLYNRPYDRRQHDEVGVRKARSSHKVIMGKFDPLYGGSEQECQPFASYQFTITVGTPYCKHGKGHRHEFVGVNYDKQTVAPDARCKACGKQVEFDSTYIRPRPQIPLDTKWEDEPRDEGVSVSKPVIKAETPCPASEDHKHRLKPVMNSDGSYMMSCSKGGTPVSLYFCSECGGEGELVEK